MCVKDTSIIRLISSTKIVRNGFFFSYRLKKYAIDYCNIWNFNLNAVWIDISINAFKTHLNEINKPIQKRQYMSISNIYRLYRYDNFSFSLHIFVIIWSQNDIFGKKTGFFFSPHNEIVVRSTAVALKVVALLSQQHVILTQLLLSCMKSGLSSVDVFYFFPSSILSR